MLTADYLAAINAPGINTLTVEWQTDVAPAARHRGHTLTKITSAVVMTGIDYATLSVNNGTATGSLPWGEWKMFPYLIEHKGTEYARLNVIDGSLRCTYMVDGVPVDRDTFNGYLTPSQAKAKRPNGGTISVKMSNVRLVGEPAFSRG